MTKEIIDEIDRKIKSRFKIIDKLTDACMSGKTRSLIISGPPGIGKSFSVERKITEWDPNKINHRIIKGYVRATGLIKVLYMYKEKSNVLVFDDSDAIFFDDTSLSILKAVCDTTKQRKVSWLSEKPLICEETAEKVPRTFDFNGSVIFITNQDFDAMINRGHKLAAHFKALISRSHYIDVGIKTTDEYLIRIKQVIIEGMLNELKPEHRGQVYEYIVRNHKRLRELSLRMVIKIAEIRQTNDDDLWKDLVDVTCCRV